MSDALRSLARRYREQPAGTPGTRNPRATGSVADTSKPEDYQGVAGHGTPRTPGTPENSNVREEATEHSGLTAADPAAMTMRLSGTAPPRIRGPKPNVSDPAPPMPPLPVPGGSERMRAAAQAEVATSPLVAARRRPPSWADPTALPPRECICTCCQGQRWWCERESPKGWRCSACHPPDQFPADAVMEVTT